MNHKRKTTKKGSVIINNTGVVKSIYIFIKRKTFHLLVVSFEGSMMEDVEASLVSQCEVYTIVIGQHLHNISTVLANGIM